MANERGLEAVGTSLLIGSLTLCLKSSGSFGVDGGDPIDVTCLGNTLWETKQPQALISAMDIPFTAEYHPSDLPTVIGEINKNQLLTIQFYDASNITFWGFLKSFEPKEASKGEEWQGSGVLVVTNLNAVGAEVAPQYNAA
jgi:hypothetical protein